MPYSTGYSGGYSSSRPNGFNVIIDWSANSGSVTYGGGMYGAGTYGVGTVSDYFDDVTSLVRPRQGAVSAAYGRDQSTAFAPTVSGRGSFILDNSDRRFSPRNTSSPLYGSLKPARPVTITRTINSIEYVLFKGHTDDNPINPDPNTKTAAVSLVDSLADFRGVNISTSLYSGIFTGQAIGYILNACGWTGLRDLDRGSTVIPWWWEDNTDALDALEKVLRSEGPPAMLTVRSDGGIVFRDRHHRLRDAPSITSQQTWRSDPGVEPVMQSMEYDEAWRNIINTGTVQVDVRRPSSREAVWTIDSPIAFSASETKTFIAATSDPFRSAIEPELDTDYTVTAGSISSVSLSRTSGASTTITITAGGGGAQIDRLQLRANPIQVAYSVQVTASDAASIDDHGPRSFPTDLPWCNQYDAQAILDTAIQMRANPLPVVTVKFQIAPDAKAVMLLARDLSDRMKIYEDETALDGVDFFIESIAHEMPSPSRDHVVEFGCEAVPPDGPATASNVFLIDGGTGHQIGDGVLAP